MSKLAINGAKPLGMKPLPIWPAIGKDEIDAVNQILKEGKLGRIKRFGVEESSYADCSSMYKLLRCT